MDEISATLIMKALEGLNQRYLYTAQNIANAGTADYRPVRVSFEESLRAAAARGPEAVRDVEPRIHFEDAAEASPQRLDLELANASRTAARYRSLVDILARQMSLHRAIVTASGR